MYCPEASSGRSPPRHHLIRSREEPGFLGGFVEGFELAVVELGEGGEEPFPLALVGLDDGEGEGAVAFQSMRVSGRRGSSVRVVLVMGMWG